MPYLQLDVNDRYPTEDKKRLAARLCDTYSRMMSVDIRRISIAIREIGEGGVWRTIDGEPVHFESKDALVKESLTNSLEALLRTIEESMGRRKGHNAVTAAIEDY